MEKEDKKKVVVSGAATAEEDAFPKVVSNSYDGNCEKSVKLSLSSGMMMHFFMLRCRPDICSNSSNTF